jgi:dienelactone hydrolase
VEKGDQRYGLKFGTNDPLLDTRRSRMRWTTTGNQAELGIYPGSDHGFTVFPNKSTKSVMTRMEAFLNRVLG